jgi:hypothetical protein
MKGVTSVTVSVPLTICRRGGRKQIIGPDGAVARPGDNGAGFVPMLLIPRSLVRVQLKKPNISMT